MLTADTPSQDDWQKVRPAPGKLFIVADPKQSIYRFRRADVAIYQKIKRQLTSVGAKCVYLSVSFRSVPEIQELVNTTMQGAMKPTASNHQADYVALEPSRPSMEGQPAVVALPIPQPYGDWGKVAFYAMQRSEPTAVAAWVRWLIEDSGFRVGGKEAGDERPITPSDVCLLFRRLRTGRQSITLPYVEALQALDVPHVLLGGRGFHQREEIEAMRVALTAVERPDDELSVFATLRGALFSLSDDTLFQFRNRHGPLHPFRAPGKEIIGEDALVLGALDGLARLHKARNYRPIALTIRELLDINRAQAGFAMWQSGDQVLANVFQLIHLARSFEESGGLSFRGFVEHLDALAADAERSEQPVIEEGVDGVRLMTVHKAKGLEFPVVVLCDVTCSMSMGASRHVDPVRRLFAVRLAGGSPWELLDNEDTEGERDAAESLRLLYVAATRARDLLAVPVVDDEPPKNSWVGPLHPGLYPEPKSRRLPTVESYLPRFQSPECVLERGFRSPVQPGDGIRPGIHKPRTGRHEVVWWDPALFESGAPTKPTLRRARILEPQDEDGPTRGAEAHEDWSRSREQLIETGASPSLRVSSVTRQVEDAADSPMPAAGKAVEIVEVAGRDPQRPGGKRFGTLVHELLARADLGGDADDVAAMGQSLARTLDATAIETDAAVTAVAAALGHPLLAEARSAARVHRETPLLHRTSDAGLVEAVPDLAFQASPEAPWIVIDFKTDLRLDIGQDDYRRQLAAYVEGLEAATGQAARGILLYV